MGCFFTDLSLPLYLRDPNSKSFLYLIRQWLRSNLPSMPKKSPLKNKTAAQLTFRAVNGWGGKRRGAGRPNHSGLVSHMKRDDVDFKKPLHLTLKIRHSNWNLRCGEIAAQFKRSAERAQSFGLRILHYSILKDHIHLLVEAANNSDLAAGMRSFGSSFGKALRKIFGGVGSVFAGRYHLHVLRNPTVTKRALGYVLQNWAKHSKRLEHLDAFSSAPYFGHWKDLFGRQLSPILEGHKAAVLPHYLSPPMSWLARGGWKRGLA